MPQVTIICSRTPRTDIRRTWPDPPRLPQVRLVQHEREEIGSHLGYLRARRPAIPSSSVHQVQAVSSHAIPSPPSRCRAARRAVAATRFTTAPDTQGALSLPGEGLDLRKLVAGAGFEPATSRVGPGLLGSAWADGDG